MESEEAPKRWTKHNAWLTLRRKRARREAIEAYGGRCVCCGEDEFEFLTFDHKNSDGAAHRKTVKMYFPIWLQRQGYPDDIQLMCWNCNCSKNVNGYCPHENKIIGRSF